MELALSTLLASVAGGRRYWGRKPEGTIARPYVVMQRITGVRDYTYGGPTNYVESRVQFDVYADTYVSARDTTNALIAVISGYRGGDIMGIFIDGQRDMPAAAPGEVSTLYRVTVDAFVHHR